MSQHENETEEISAFEKGRDRYIAYIKTLTNQPRAGRVFEAGAISLRRHLEYFIMHQLRGERGDAFSMGQDDGLRWVLDELDRFFCEAPSVPDPKDPDPGSDLV